MTEKEKLAAYSEAKRSAKNLAEVLRSVDFQIDEIEKGTGQHVYYYKDWLQLYFACAPYLKYDYLEYLLEEFEYVERINDSINKGDKDYNAIIEERHKDITDSTRDFNIASVTMNLAVFSMGMTEDVPWKQKDDYKNFDRYFKENYRETVKEYTSKFLKNNGGSCSSNEAAYYVLGILKKDPMLHKSEYELITIQNKTILNSIHHIYQKLDENDDFSLCWGELTLKEEK